MSDGRYGYRLDVVQAHKGTVVSSVHHVPMAVVDDGGSGLLATIARSMDHTLLDACGHVDAARRWTMQPYDIWMSTPGGQHDDYEPLPDGRVYFLDGPHAGEGAKAWLGRRNEIRMPIGVAGVATYDVHSTATGLVGVHRETHYNVYAKVAPPC